MRRYVVVTPSTNPDAGTVHGAMSYAGDALATVPLTALPMSASTAVPSVDATVRPALH